jgi:hypothetical protein
LSKLIPGSSIAIVALIILTAAIIPCEPKPVYAQQQSLQDPNLAVESFVEGLTSPTSMGLMELQQYPDIGERWALLF